MNKYQKIVTTFISVACMKLGFLIAIFVIIGLEPSPHYAIESRYLNYTEKDCYTKLDIELIVFGKVLNEIDCENCDEID